MMSCFTIGHSNHSLDKFINLLKSHNVNCLVDIRSSPFSNHNPHFNREALGKTLSDESIVYLYMGDKLGARFTDRNLQNSDGQVDFSKVRESAFFNEGIDRVISGIKKGYVIALMCSERNPMDCHRFALVAYQLVRKDVAVEHILEDGCTISNKELENRMLSEFKKRREQATLFEAGSNKVDNNLGSSHKSVGHFISP